MTRVNQLLKPVAIADFFNGIDPKRTFGRTLGNIIKPR